MPILAQCGSCGHRGTVADQYAGQRFACPHCGQAIQVPAANLNQPYPAGYAHPQAGQPSAGVPNTTPQHSYPAYRPQAAPNSGENSQAVTWALIGGGALAVLMIVVAVVFTWGGNEVANAPVANDQPAAPPHIPPEEESSSTPLTEDTALGQSPPPSGYEVSWTVTADGSVFGPASYNVTPVNLGQGTEGVLFPSQNTTQCVTWRGKYDGRSLAEFVAFDLSTQKEIAKTELPGEDVEHFDVSPDGTHIAVRIEDEMLRVFRLSGESFEEIRNVPNGDSDANGWLLPNNLLLVSDRRRLTVWRMPDWQHVHSLSWKSSFPIVFSPNRKYFLHVTDDSSESRAFDFFETATGKHSGRLGPLAPEFRDTQSISFRADGRQLASFHPTLRSDNGTILIWDFATQDIVKECLVPKNIESLRWAGDRYLLATASHDSTFVVDVATRVVIWRFKNTGDIRATQGDLCWYTFDQEDYYSSLAAVRLPTDEMQQALAGSDNALRPIVSKNDAVTLTVDVKANRAATDLKTQIIEKFKVKLGHIGVTAEPGQPVTMRVSMTAKTEGNAEFQSVTGRDQRFSVPNHKIRLAVEVSDASGEAKWTFHTNWSIGSYFGGLRTLPSNVNPAQYLLKEQWESFDRWLDTYELPKTIYPNGNVQGFGESILGSDV